MRILLFSNWLPPIRSGSSYYTSSLGKALLSKGHEVAVVTLDWGAEYQPEDQPFKIYRLPVIIVPKLSFFFNLKLMGFAFTPANCRRLCRIIEEFRPDVLHHVNHIFDTTFLTAYASRKKGIPIVGSITTPVQHQNPIKQFFMGLLDRFTLGLFGVRKWNAVVSLDQTAHLYVGKVYGRKVQERSVVIPFGVRLESAALYEDRSFPKAARPQILMVGHIHPFRNPVQLIRAMPEVLKECPDARLVLAGRVDLKEPVLEAKKLGLSPEEVLFLGDTAHEKVVQLMKESHVFASWVTGPYPGLGTAAMEAMLCEAVVMNDLPENLFGEGKLKNGENIVLVDSKDIAAIAKALIRILKDDTLRNRIGQGGREFVLRHLNWDRISVEIEILYGRLLAGNPAGSGDSPCHQFSSPEINLPQ